MPSNNSKYTQEIREQTAKNIIENGKSATGVAEEMGIDKNTVCSWVREYRRKNNMPSYTEEKGIQKKAPRTEGELLNKIKELEKELKRKDKELRDEREKVEIIGYAVSKDIDTELVCKALSNAIQRNGRPTEGLVFHSDRGSQYCSKRYQKMLEENRITGSMSKAGCPYDNSCMESFFASMKKEHFSRREYVTIESVEMQLFSYIELFYNRKRLHSSLGYMSPVAFRLKHMGKTAA